MANNTDNLRSSITATTTTNNRPNNGTLPSSVAQSVQQNNRDLLHPKVRFKSSN